MSTTIKSLTSWVRISVDLTDVGIETTVPGGRREIIRAIPRADFLAAVATECNVRIVPADAIVIERGELPETRVGTYGEAICQGWTRAGHANTETVRSEARALLAIAEHLDAHPPIDEAQVKALARLIADHVDPASLVGSGERVSTTSADLARGLVLAGVRIEAK